MNPILQGKKTEGNRNLKNTGYILSAIGLILTNLGLYFEWQFTPIWLILTMYFLTGSLWIPALIKPFYKIFCSAAKASKRSSGTKSNMK